MLGYAILDVRYRAIRVARLERRANTFGLFKAVPEVCYESMRHLATP